MTSRTQQFELRVFPEAGGQQDFYFNLRGESAARSRAGDLCKKFNGPVDLAYSGDEDWSERYISTASPSEHHARGYRFERFD